MQELNKIYLGNSLQLIKELEINPDLIIMSPPDINETEFSLDQYKQFIYSIYSDCAQKLKDGGVLVSITTDTKYKGTIFTKHIEIINSVKDQLNLFNYKIWAKSLKTNLYILNFCHMTFFCKGKRPIIKNHLSEFLPDVWVIESDKIKGYKNKDSFPSELVRRLILTFTNPDSLILDPFIGSGKTAKIARSLNRNFIGFEIDQNFVNIANQLLTTP